MNGTTINKWTNKIPTGTKELKLISKNCSKDKEAIDYYEQIHTFDIEVTNYHNGETRAGVVYLWTYALDSTTVVYGRTIEEFKEFLDDMTEEHQEGVQVIYVHNLSYEFQFLRGYFEFGEVFAVDRRKVLKAQYKNFEFRCSYLLTNKSLKKFLDESSTVVKKLNYDYSIERYPWQEISEEEIEYCVHDTLGLLQALEEKMKKENNNVTTIPQTSTGYVRRDIKKATNGTTHRNIEKIAKYNAQTYIRLKSAFIGGNCHANRFHVGKILENIYCYDIASSYPYVQMTEDFPVSPFQWTNPAIIEKHGMDDKFAYLLTFNCENLHLKNPTDGMPVISAHKCKTAGEVEIDNGRILFAERIKFTVTDIESKIILSHYTADKIKIVDSFSSRYGQLPEQIKTCILGYFTNKCTLKKSDPYNYMKSKNLLNSIYGMSAFDVGRARFRFENNDYIKDTRPIDEILADFNEHTYVAEPYQWGVWTTSHARKNLNELIEQVGDRFVYCDTDSVYCMGSENVENLNKKIKKKSERYKVSYGGKDFYLGIWEEDKICKQFVTLGAKKYAYTDDNGVHTVTAGVNKSAGVTDIHDYKIGHVFKNATTGVWYNDEMSEIEIDGHKCVIPSSMYLENADYTLGISNDYSAILGAINGFHVSFAQNF